MKKNLNKIIERIGSTKDGTEYFLLADGWVAFRNIHGSWTKYAGYWGGSVMQKEFVKLHRNFLKRKF